MTWKIVFSIVHIFKEAITICLVALYALRPILVDWRDYVVIRIMIDEAHIWVVILAYFVLCAAALQITFANRRLLGKVFTKIGKDLRAVKT